MYELTVTILCKRTVIHTAGVYDGLSERERQDLGLRGNHSLGWLAHSQCYCRIGKEVKKRTVVSLMTRG